MFYKDISVLAVRADRRLPGHEFIYKLEAPSIVQRLVFHNSTGDNPANEVSVAISFTAPREAAFREIWRGGLQAGSGSQEFATAPTQAVLLGEGRAVGLRPFRTGPAYPRLGGKSLVLSHL